MQFFSKVLFTDLFFFLFQYLQSTCYGHTQCDAKTLEKVLNTCCFSYFSFYRIQAKALLCVMQFFSKVLFTDLFFFLIQYLQKTCDGQTQCNAITLLKSLTYLLFLLLQSLQRTCELHTPCDAIFLRSTFTDLFFFLIQCL